MSLEEAMAFLGVTEDADAKAVKRAYHKLLKRHKPDSDPDGFQRLRAAFARVNERLHEREVFVSPQSADPAEPPTPAPVHDVDPDVVYDALCSGDVERALALVLDDRWAQAMLDDEHGALGWATRAVAKVAVLANRAGYDALRQRYPELDQDGMDEELALLLRASPDWQHLLAHEDVPPAFCDFVVLAPAPLDWSRRIELARGLASWYWSDPVQAWRSLSATLSRRRALASYLAELLLHYEDLAGEGTQPLPVEETDSPTRVLAPLTTPFMVLAVLAGVSTYIFMTASASSAWIILARVAVTAFAVLVVMFLELLVYNAWPSLRRRYLHACMAVDTPPEDAAWSLTGHFMLRHAIAGDPLMDIAFQIGRLGRLDPE